MFNLDMPSNRLSNPLPRIASFGDVPPRAKFRRFQTERGAWKFAQRMAEAGRLFKSEEPVVAQRLDSRIMFFVNYRNKR